MKCFTLVFLVFATCLCTTSAFSQQRQLASSSSTRFSSHRRSRTGNQTPTTTFRLPLKMTPRAESADTMTETSPKARSKMTIDEIYAQAERDGKKMAVTSTSTFLGTTLIGVPLWLFVLLPMTATYQVGKSILKPILPNNQEKEQTPALSAQPEQEIPMPSNVTPRKDRKYDIVLLGATGFTGKLATTHLVKTYGVGKDSNVRWAIAGRNAAKLEQVKRDIADELGQEDVLKLDTILVDTSDITTIPTLVQDARAVVSTAGPFARYGSPVVEGCVKYGTHYADITGEVEWSKTMIHKWDTLAQQTGAKIISFCGHDCIPWDLCVYKLNEALQQDCQEELVSATCFDEVKGAASGGTIETALGAIEGTAMNAPKTDFDPLLKLPDGTKSTFRSKDNHPSVIEKHNGPGRFSSTWVSPFVMAGVNAAVVKRSNALSTKGSKSLTYREVQVNPDFKTSFTNFFSLVFGVTALMNPLTGALVRKSLPKPGEGPSRKEMERFFLKIVAEGVGSGGSKAECAIYYDRCAGYTDTARMVAESGLALACNEDELPNQKGGFWTPATGLGDVLLNRLVDTGTYFAPPVIVSRNENGSIRSKL